MLDWIFTYILVTYCIIEFTVTYHPMIWLKWILILESYLCIIWNLLSLSLVTYDIDLSL